MAVYRDKERGTWYTSFRYTDWTGERKQKLKRGFRTKKDAQNYEREFIRTSEADMDMMMGNFIEVYFKDKKGELRQTSVRNKRYMMNKHVIPYFGKRKMNEITPSDVIQWQNKIREMHYSQTYERMIQNQLTTLFSHATKIYSLQNNPCKKVKKMGKSDADKLDFWTKEEYEQFIKIFDRTSQDYIMFEILFWTGIRSGDDDDKIRLNQRKPSKYKGLRRFGPEKNLQRINKFMREWPLFCKNHSEIEKDFSTCLSCPYYTMKAVIIKYSLSGLN